MEKMKCELTVYRDGISAKYPNRRLTIIQQEDGFTGIEFTIIDGSTSKRAVHIPIRSWGCITCLKLSDEAIEVLHHTLCLYLQERKNFKK